MTLQSLEVGTTESLDRALRVMAQEYSDGLIVVTDPFLSAHRTRIVESTNRQKVPAVLDSKSSSRAAGSYRMAPAFPRCTGAPLPTWTNSQGREGG